MTGWWTGRYAVAGRGRAAAPPPAPAVVAPRVVRAPGQRLPANEQLTRARERARVRRERAHARVNARRGGRVATGVRRHDASGRWGTAGALVFALLVGGLAIGALVAMFHDESAASGVVVSRGVSAESIPSVVEASASVGSSIETSARVLVLSDLPVPMSPETEAAVYATLDDLAMAGAHLEGDLVSGDGSIDLVAKARRDRGAAPLTGETIGDQLGELFDGEGFDAVLWVEPVREGKGGQRWVLISGRTRAAATLHDQNAAGSLLPILGEMD